MTTVFEKFSSNQVRVRNSRAQSPKGPHVAGSGPRSSLFYDVKLPKLVYSLCFFSWNQWLDTVHVHQSRRSYVICFKAWNISTRYYTNNQLK